MTAWFTPRSIAERTGAPKRYMTLRMQHGYRLALTASAVLVLFAYKAATIARLQPLPITLAWALELATLSTLWVGCEFAQRLPLRPLRALAVGLFYTLFYVVVVTALAHTFFFESAAERRFSLLELDLRTLAFFFRSVLPVRGWLILSGLVLAIHALAYALRSKLVALRLPRAALALGALWCALGVALTAHARVPSPLADAAATLIERLTTREIAIDRKQPARYSPRQLDKSEVALGAHPELPFQNVLVFVMETMTSEMFAREAKQLPATTFVNSARSHTHEHTRYFATNQDSRTGMLSMLGARFIPYEAYTEEGRDGYMFLGQKSSLVDVFRGLGYRTAFAVSQVEMELVVSDLPWDERLHFEPDEIAPLRGEHLCFVPYEFEHSCEDRALLPRVLSFIDRNERVFLYQEFIWGHASEYNEASGKTNTEYYSAYLDAVLAHLQKTGKAANTLIVLTADHGFRDKGLQTQQAVYHIPLWFHADRYTSQRDDRLFSHLDFKSLLLHELSPAAAPRPAESPFVMIVGPTGTSFLTVLTQSGQFLLMKARGDERYLLRGDGLSGPEDPAPTNFLRLFEDYQAYFTGLRG